MPKTYDLHTPYGDYKCLVKRSKYKHDGSLAVWLEGEDGSPICRVTTNIGSMLTGTRLAFVDTNNCPYLDDFLKSNGLATDTLVRGRSGFCEYPLYRFNTSEIEEVKQ